MQTEAKRAASIAGRIATNERKLAYLESQTLTPAERAKIAKAKALSAYPCGNALTLIAAEHCRADLAAMLPTLPPFKHLVRDIEAARQLVESPEKVAKYKAFEAGKLWSTHQRLIAYA
ncbi:hypothetical protein ACC685_33420 [Rhizobium ruizarguesonis]